MKNSTLDKITSLLEILEKENILSSLFRVINYPDEPQMFHYSAILSDIKKFTDGTSFENTASGFSFTSKSLALLKCVMEAVERFASLCYRNNDLIFSTYDNLKLSAVDPCLFIDNKKLDTKQFGWISGYDLFTGKQTLIPAQSVFYNYQPQTAESFLAVPISTGGAGGYDHESTLLRALYEIIERDSFMSVYLTKSRVPRLDTENLKNKSTQQILTKAKRYKLEVMLFEITTDLKIPTYLSLVLDRTGLGPSVSMGLKSSMSQETAILGSLEESFLTRPWMRNEMLTHSANQFSFKPESLETIKERGLLWVSTKMLKHLKFLLDQPLQQIIFSKFTLDSQKELALLKLKLVKKNIKAFYADITPKEFNKTDIKIYKVIVPELQPMFFKERTPEIRSKRLTKVAEYFNNTQYTINKIPHPFL